MEIVVSLGLLAVAGLLVMGVISRAALQSGKTAHQTAAVLLADELMERSVLVGPPGWSFGVPASSQWVGERVLQLPSEESATTFRYRLQVLELRDSSDDLGTVHQLTYTVWWEGEAPAARVELGTTSIKRVRTLYVRR